MDLNEEIKRVAIGHMNESLDRIDLCLSQLDKQEIWQRPNSSSNAIGNLIIHLCGNITQYIISSLGGKPDDRVRDLEFDSKRDESSEKLLMQLEEVIKEATTIIEGQTREQLLRVRKVQGFTLSGVAILIHVVEHLSYHTGQIVYVTKQLKDIDLKLYGDIDLNAKNEE